LESYNPFGGGKTVPGETVSFSKGSILFDKDQPPRRMYLLKSGQVRLSSDDQAILDHLQPGCFFNEKMLLDGASPEQTAKALTDVEALCFRKTELFAKVRTDPAFAARLLRDLASRIDRYEQTIRDLVTEKADMRLARLLYRHAPAGRSAWVRIPFELSNLDLARMVGTTRWRISHLLSRFQRLGWLRRNGGLWLRRDGVRDYLLGKV
jgi:CRP-like cAMP-binding protein